jgi:aminoglycoside phosphotransferase family enzyme/predicted kinase
MPFDPRMQPDSSEILAFLGNTKSFPHEPSTVRILQTHASYVAIVPPLVYKIKKPVDFGFLNFSTLDLRKHYCKQEVRLNRRLSKNVYLDVVPIYRTAAGLTFEGQGEIVEYAVKMSQLDESWFMKRLLDLGKIEKKDIDRIVEALCHFYKSQQPSSQVAEWGRVDRLRISTDENFVQTEPYVGELVSQAAFEAIRAYTNEFYADRRRLLNRRRVFGHILDCHGDLHLEHIHLAPDILTIYDCIEFNERLRFLDVANDIAFLCMDLDVHGHGVLAGYFAKEMAEKLKDGDLLHLLDFYKCYRAYVRAKVNSFRSSSEEVPEDERKRSEDIARAYYGLSLQYALSGSSPLVIVIMGRVGTGKSLHAHRLGKALGWPVYSSDAVRKGAAGLPLFERSDAATRRQLYSEERTNQVYQALTDAALRHGAGNSGCVLDATYGRRKHRDALRNDLRAAGLRHCFVELESPLEEVEQRLEARKGSDDVVSDARAEDLPMLLDRYEAPDALEDMFHFTVSTEPPREMVSLQVMKTISRLFRI